MKVKLGNIVSSEYGTGPVVAMSKEWCIHEDEAGNEAAVPWCDVRVEIEPAVCVSLIDEMDMAGPPEVDHEQRDETVRIESDQEQPEIPTEPPAV